MHGFKRVQKCVHHEDSDKSCKYRWIFPQIDEQQDKNNHEKEKPQYSTLDELLNIPALGDIVMLGTENKVWITCQKYISEIGHLGIQRGNWDRVLIHLCYSSTRWSCLRETMSEWLLEKSEIADIHALKMR